jgi:RimJ/RimL family protein N-acetyltransferase
MYSSSKFSIVPLRNEDKLLIMKWRNEQIYHLRQQELLTASDQEKYFSTVVAIQFKQDHPAQLLFSYLEDNICIGYGGLVHINWKDKHAELSFIMNTELEKDFFAFHWTTYLSLIEQVAFLGLGFHKIFTYAFDLRPYLYSLLEASGYQKEARLREHIYFDGKYIDVIIHSKINN